MGAWTWRAFDELTPLELYEILQLRALAFVVEQQCVYNDLDGADPHGHHLFGRDETGEMVAYLRVIQPGVKYAEPSIGRVVTHPRLRGSGRGIALMNEGLRWTEAKYPGGGVRINAQQRLERFYQDLGFTTTSEPYELDGIQHVEMVRPSPPGGAA